MEKDTSLTSKRILIFIGITFLITYAAEFGIIYPLSARTGADFTGASSVLLQLTTAAMMFLPALCILYYTCSYIKHFIGKRTKGITPVNCI